MCLSSGANVDYQAVRETVTFGPSKTNHTSTVSILRSGTAARTFFSSALLSIENDYNIDVKFLGGVTSNLFFWSP